MTSGQPPDDPKSYFASVAESYDRLQPILAGPAYEAGLAFVLDLVPHQEQDAFICVELGCGTGTLTHRVLCKFPRARALAVDSEPAMLDMARKKLAPHGDRIEVRQADVLACELPSCDVVLSSFMFHHVPPERLEGTLRRIARGLAPSGCLVLLDHMTVGPRWSERIGAQNRRLQRGHVAAAIAAGRATQDDIDARWAFKRKMKEQGQDVEYRHRAEDITEAMRAAGFDEIGLVWLRFGITILMAFVAQDAA